MYINDKYTIPWRHTHNNSGRGLGKPCEYSPDQNNEGIGNFPSIPSLHTVKTVACISCTVTFGILVDTIKYTINHWIYHITITILDTHGNTYTHTLAPTVNPSLTSLDINPGYLIHSLLSSWSRPIPLNINPLVIPTCNFLRGH